MQYQIYYRCDLNKGKDDHIDTDNDGLPDDFGHCELGDDGVDNYGDGIPNGCDDNSMGEVEDSLELYPNPTYGILNLFNWINAY